MEDRSALERTYSKEQQLTANDLQHLSLTESQFREATRTRTREQDAASNRIRINEEDVNGQLDLEKEVEYRGEKSPSSTSLENGNEPPRRIIRFEDNDPAQPNNWNRKWKLYSLFTSIMMVMNSTMASSLAAGASAHISTRFGVKSEYLLILPTSMYLAGYVGGPLIFGPLSEHYGRKWTMLYGFIGFTIFSIASAASPNFAALVIFRFLTGVNGACPIAVVGGICADIYHNPEARGKAMAVFMSATVFGPVIAPPISGYISNVSWNWGFWIGAIFAGATWPVLLLFPETYAPVILKKRAQKLRKETGDDSIIAPLELERTDIRHILVVVLTRPVRMILFEPLVYCTCLYLSYAYGLFYLFFQSYPIIFGGIYGFNAGEEGLAFIPIGVGAVLSVAIYYTFDYILGRATAQGKPWTKTGEMRRLPLACIAGPFFVISLFWAGWSARESVHWIVPVLSGMPFGIGFLLLFMAMLNYLIDAYEIFAASAMAATSTSRSVFGAVLPFAAKPMYQSLGVAWACSLLGFLSLAMCGIPLLFIKYGPTLRAKSKFCQYLAQKKREEAEKEEREADGRVPGDLEAGSRKTEGVVRSQKEEA